LSVILSGSKSFLIVDTLILALRRTIQLEKSIISKFGGFASPVPLVPTTPEVGIFFESS
jgi:hypothetical protein